MTIHEIWRTHQYIGMILFSLVFGFIITKRFHWIAGLLCSYVMVSALWVFQNPDPQFGAMSGNFGRVSSQAFAAFLLVISVVAFASSKLIKNLVIFVEVATIVDCILVYLYGYGFFNNPSLDASFIMMMFPALCFRPNRFIPRSFKDPIFWILLMVVLLPFIALFRINESTPYFVLAGCLMVLCWKRKHLLIGGVGCALFAGALMNKQFFLRSNGRMDFWELFIGNLFSSGKYLLGAGTGTLEWAGPLIQIHNKTLEGTPGHWKGAAIWMHNEYLQVLFEQGILGLVLMLGLMAICWQRAKPIWLKACLAGAAVCFLTQYPIRFFLGQLWIALLVRICLDGYYSESKDESSAHVQAT